MSECACRNWASDGQFAYAMTGHHSCCPKLDPGALLRRTETLLWKLVVGMEVWASDEDGVHDAAWDGYAEACRMLGKVAPGEKENERA